MDIKRWLVVFSVGLFVVAGIAIFAPLSYAAEGEARCKCNGAWSGSITWSVDGASASEVGINCVDEKSGKLTADVDKAANSILFDLGEDGGTSCVFDVPSGDVGGTELICGAGSGGSKVRISCGTRVKEG